MATQKQASKTRQNLRMNLNFYYHEHWISKPKTIAHHAMMQSYAASHTQTNLRNFT